MSTEGRMKRGTAGAGNAKGISFRYGGSKCNYSYTLGNPAWHPYAAGSKLVQAMHLGAILPGFNPSPRLLAKTDKAMEDRCTAKELK